MRDSLLINDIHLGAQRVAGTTQASQLTIRLYLLEKLEELLFQHTDKDAIVNGDLFDAFWVQVLDALAFYDIARRWLIASGGKMRVGRGNHDGSKDSSKLSSFDMVCRILQTEFPGRFLGVAEPQWLDGNIYMVPHMANQDLFDLALSKVAEFKFGEGMGGLLLLHANWNNHFTIESDHSLNVSEEQSKRLVDAGWTLIFGHEHQKREPAQGVIVTGNQWPSSVADCLNNPDNVKAAHIIKANGTLEPIITWRAEDDFAEVDWRELGNYDGNARFIRVVGEANSDEGADVIDTISRYRRDTEVFVVTNAVVVEGVADMGELKATAENIKAFDVMGYLLEQLDPEQAAKVRDLIAKDENQVQEAA